MSRSRATAKQAGTKFERGVADYLAEKVDDRIDRRAKTGSKDRGDIGGIRLSVALRGGRVVVQCKNVVSTALGPWVNAAEIQRGNDDAVVGCVIHKRFGTGDIGKQFVTMTVDDFIALLTGERPCL